jgi:hypothetical protein
MTLNTDDAVSVPARTRFLAEVRNIDVHQHLWPIGFQEALRRRTSAPRLVDWTLLVDGEPPYQVDPRAHDATARAAIEDHLGAALVIRGLSSPLGIEDLPADQADDLLDAWHDGVADLPNRFRAGPRYADASRTSMD